jgi:hypothetical protein
MIIQACHRKITLAMISISDWSIYPSLSRSVTYKMSCTIMTIQSIVYRRVEMYNQVFLPSNLWLLIESQRRTLENLSRKYIDVLHFFCRLTRCDIIKWEDEKFERKKNDAQRNNTQITRTHFTIIIGIECLIDGRHHMFNFVDVACA